MSSSVPADVDGRSVPNRARLPRTGIFDVDGTLALIGDRSPYDMRNVSIDTPHHPVVMAAQALAAHPDVDALLVVSGRDETARRRPRHG
jgi:hypothetical protein